MYIFAHLLIEIQFLIYFEEDLFFFFSKIDFAEPTHER